MNITGIERLPEHCQLGVRNYIERGIPMGRFLTAVFSNDLMGAFLRADSINQERLVDYVIFLDSHAPSPCHGSPEAVRAWIERGGLGNEPEQQHEK